MRPNAALAKRLETLTQDDGAACAARHRSLAQDARARPRFRAALAQAKALADENRLLAASLLRQRGELCACELQAALAVSHATVSHHVAVLEGAGLVASERRGKFVYYRLTPEAHALVP